MFPDSEDLGDPGNGAEAPRGAPHDPSPVLAELGSLIIRLRRRDLSLTAELVLVNLDRSGPGRVGDLAALAGVSQPTMTELLARLGRDGLIGRDSHPGDRRAVSVSISEHGRDLLRRRRAETDALLHELIASLSAEDRTALGAATPALARLVAQGPAAPER
jgi:DNA-binding MarR family transcriptional regulator